MLLDATPHVGIGFVEEFQQGVHGNGVSSESDRGLLFEVIIRGDGHVVLLPVFRHEALDDLVGGSF